ncbi:APC family permease [Quadrisphaera granulorum]|uniref:APC family permease n=1 Tax=Quadrisphaera granulorum TaxID=317664 RepID=UPI000D6B0364|nr:APC family permease [Quadrisphaera granulorum]
MATTTSAPVQGEAGEPELKRAIGTKLLFLFIIGDVLGTGIYALTGQVASEVGGAVWIPFLVAFAVAMLTACSYLELVTKYPKCAGAALYTHKAFGVHVLTFMVAFTVMCSGITSASTASRAFSSNSLKLFGVETPGALVVTVVALAFMLLVAAINLRGVGESVKANMVLTLIELSGLLIVIAVGAWALLGGQGDLSRAASIDLASDQAPFTAITAATALAFFALVGFEDSVNMAEETHDPIRTFPKVMFLALGTAGVLYLLVGVIAVAVVPLDALSEGDTPLLQVVSAGAPNFPIGIFALITMFAVANSALLNMLMASRLLYGMSQEGVLPRFLGRVLRGRRTPWTAVVFSTCLSLILISVVSAIAAADPGSKVVSNLGGTTSLLLLAVFSVVHIAVLVLRRDRVDHQHFKAPTVLPYIGAAICLYLVTPLTPREPIQYQIAGALLTLGLVLWFFTWLSRRRKGLDTRVDDPARLGG